MALSKSLYQLSLYKIGQFSNESSNLFLEIGIGNPARIVESSLRLGSIIFYFVSRSSF